MKKLLIALLIAGQGTAFAQSLWEVSPLTWENSPLTWENSPHNWDNSIVGSNSGLYDGTGVRIGYATTTPSGATNVYLNNGHRVGYVPARSNIMDDDVDYLPARRVSEPLGRFTPISEYEPPARGRFIPIEAEPRGRFTPLSETMR